MPFEPKFIPEEPAPLDAEGGLILDATLAELAARLSQDARSVDRLREAAAPGSVAPRSRRGPSGGRWLRWLPWAVAGLTAITIGTINPPPTDAPPPQRRPTQSAPPLTDSTNPLPVRSESLFTPVELQPWTQMSEPELEGFLDLQPRPAAGISI